MIYEIAIVVILLAGMVYLVKRKKKNVTSATPEPNRDNDTISSQDKITKLK
jgi:hypothetical protein